MNTDFQAPLNDQQSGILLGIPSIIFFFVAFGFGFRDKSRLTTSLLIPGCLLLAISKLVEPTIGLNLFLAVALPYLYIALILLGFIIMGLGGTRTLRENKASKQNKRILNQRTRKNARNGRLTALTK